ncbi:uncharacterized protein LOC113213921 [Frankliniella occidentalis]|uniref:RNA-directed DNA polymerase n=1 Tax=Frankliniella occidentalis TaxID=133901 RepID=A0A6J1T7R8_FRAOC|nr:uncharacterized protein LOC113213921 [Frankliniella occidentalis]
MSDDYPRFDLAHPELLEAFIRDLKLHFDAKGVITDTQKRGILYKAICVETRRYLGEWLHPSTIERETFAAIVEALQGNIKPTINQGVLFNEFVCRFQKEGESGGQYAAALRSMVEGLALGWHADRIALFQLKRGLRDSSLQRRLYREQECTLQEAKIIVNSSEVSKRCIQFVNTLTAEVHAVNFNNKPRDNGGRGSGGGKKKPNATGNLTCFRCGEAGHSVRRCGLGYNKCKCAGCGKVGHLEKACRSKKSNNSALTNYLSAQPPQSSQPSTSNVVVPPACRPFNPFAELFQIQSHQMYDPEDDPVYLTLLVNGRPITMQFDDGAQKTVIAEATFRQHFGTAMDTKMSPVELFAWGCDTPHATGSMVEVSVTFGGKTFKLPLLISPVDPKRSPTLLGRNWIRAFWGRNFLREALQIEKYSINAVEVQAARVVAPPRPQQLSPVNIGAWASKFPCATGTGTGRYNGPPVHLHLKPGSKPKYQPARSIPFPLTTKYNEAVDRNISASVWIPTEVSAWASGLVPVQKRNGELRLCADYKSTLNPALHNDSYCSPTVSEVLAAASGAKIFGELDCKEAYLQIPVDEESSMLMVVNSKRGLFRPTTLQFGVKTAPAIFQRIMDGLLGKLEGVVAYQDNVYIFASSFPQYVSRLENALLVLSQAGLRLNTEKCTFITDSLEILGFLVDAKGIHPTQEKCQAILDAPVPADEKALQSLLGIISFYSRFFKGKATILEPLHRLLDKGASFQWGKPHEEALLAVKAQLTSKAVLVHYSLKIPLVLAVDASPVGVGAVLSHCTKNSQGVEEHAPICFASRTRSKVERNYSQLDREALAIIFGVSKFHQYVFGRSFQILTDHKPLLPLLGAEAQIPEHLSPRMIRWALKLSAYDYVLLHRPGSKMGNADYLSRCPLPCEDAEMEPVGIFLLEARSWSPIGAKDIANATSADPLLKQVTHWVKFGWPQSVPEEAKPYYQKRDELSMMKGCLLRGSCAVVPPALQDIALRLAHSLHFGIAHTKAMARSLIWWPGMSRELEKEVTACEECQKNASAPPKSSSTCWPAAREVWERVHLDYAGPVEGHYLLIGIDAHSKWPVVKVVNNLTAATLITHVRYIFSDFGIPCTIVNDNGAQLVSKEFEQFLLHNNVRHVMSPPWHPASNGLAERAVRSVKELLRKFTEGDFHARLARVLHSMRNRPSSANGVSPAEVMFSNRPSRSPLRRLHPDSWPTLTSTEPPLQPGTLVWALKRVRGSTSWEAGFLKEALGCRVYVVQLNDGSILRVSVDEVRRRLTKEDDESGRPPIPTSEPEGLPTGTELPSRQPVVPPTTPVVTPETPVQEQPKTPPPTTADQEQPRTLDEVVDFIPDQQFLANADKSPEESEDDQHETASVDSHETGTPPPVLSPQGTVLHDSIQGSPSKDTESPRGRGRGRRAPGRPPGSKNVTKTGRQPLVTRSGRISQAPTHWDPWS